MHRQATGFAHVNGRIENLLNKNNFLLINVHEISSIEAPTPNIFSLKIQSHNIYYNYNTCINNRVQLIKTQH